MGPVRNKVKFSQQLLLWNSTVKFNWNPFSNFGVETYWQTNRQTWLPIMCSFYALHAYNVQNWYSSIWVSFSVSFVGPIWTNIKFIQQLL